MSFAEDMSEIWLAFGLRELGSAFTSINENSVRHLASKCMNSQSQYVLNGTGRFTSPE